MPIAVHEIIIRGQNINANWRYKSLDEAQAVYAKVLDAITNNHPLLDLNVGDTSNEAQTATFRTGYISAFGIRTFMEETPEEIKARRIAEIESGRDCYPQQGVCTGNALIGHSGF